MLEQIFSQDVGTTLSVPNVLTVIGVSLALGFLISICYMLTHRKKGWQQSFVISMIMLPPIVSIIIMLVGNNAARALSLAGAFSLVRFRSAPGDPKDIAYVFFTLAIGLACGIGYIAYGALFAIILILVMIIIELSNYASPKRTEMSLKITVPENLNFEHLYDDLLGQYAVKWTLKRIKTIDFGSLFELHFDVDLKDSGDRKAFIDLLRQRNGNLPISLTLREFEDRQTLGQ